MAIIPRCSASASNANLSKPFECAVPFVDYPRALHIHPRKGIESCTALKTIICKLPILLPYLLKKETDIQTKTLVHSR